MPLIAGIIAAFAALAEGLGVVVAYLVSKYSKQLALLIAWTTGFTLVVVGVVALFDYYVGSYISFPASVQDLYDYFVPSNFLTVVSASIGLECSLLVYRAALVVSNKYIDTLSK